MADAAVAGAMIAVVVPPAALMIPVVASHLIAAAVVGPIARLSVACAAVGPSLPLVIAGLTRPVWPMVAVVLRLRAAVAS